MSEAKIFERIRTVGTLLLVVLFLGLISLPILDSFFGLDKAPVPNEKREPAKFPQLQPGIHGFRAYLAGLEKYYSDHFGFRKRLIRWERKWKRDWFKESTISDVMQGRDGWLFFAGEQMIENFRGIRPMKPEELKDWQTLLERRRDWLAKRGIAYIFTVPPDKHSVYPEYLPDWMAGQGGHTTRLDQFIAYIKTNSTVEVLDLRQPLIDGKKIAPTYLSSDTHWNFFGAFLAYEKLIQAISKQLPDLTSVPITSFKQRPQLQQGGDLAVMSGQEQSVVEKNSIIFTAQPPLRHIEQKPVTNFMKRQTWMRNAEPVFTEVANQKGKAILFRDSFAGAWSPFIANNFNKVIYIWQYDWDPNFIETEKPSIVIDEMLERFFNKEKPRELMEKDALPD